MRQTIADITRPHYADVVEITDHAQTGIQVLGDKAHEKEKIALQLHRSLWQESPRSIPGMRPCLYFWNLQGNVESRPIAGLSACNEMEANAVAQLTKWFLICGVPPSSISIITPYKGQTTLIIKKLRDLKCLPRYTDIPPPPGSTITVSTVDRYQGDENDIIIYSNVRMRKNVFVSLPNRFIVATSRARLGFYLVGSVEAVTQGRKDTPWGSFIEKLKISNGDDSEVESEGGNEGEIGRAHV